MWTDLVDLIDILWQKMCKQKYKQAEKRNEVDIVILLFSFIYFLFIIFIIFCINNNNNKHYFNIMIIAAYEYNN